MEAENYLKATVGLPYLIMRPTAVFGPRDTELHTLFNLVSKGFEFYIGTDKQQLSFIYVKDLVNLLFDAMQSEKTNQTYYLSDGESYLIKDFVTSIKTALNKKTFKAVVPVGLVATVAFLLKKF